MTPFLRLALLVAATGYALGLALLMRWLGWGTAFAVAALGTVFAVVVTLELSPSSQVEKEEVPPEGRTLRDSGDFNIRRRGRDEIERSARLAGEE